MTEQPARERVIFDTDIGYVNDDGIALTIALASPELDVLGVTVVAGNFDRDQEVVDALSILDRLGRTDVPVYAGADRPLKHERGEYEQHGWGLWATFAPTTNPLGREPGAVVQERSAAEFIVETARASPGEVTIIALGPLTNLALALAIAPEVAFLVKRLVIMGGAISSLPRGSGNVTPTAEFNFFVDPEAAAYVLRAGIPTLLVPLNVTREVEYTAAFHEQVLEVPGIAADMLCERMGDFFGAGNDDFLTVNFHHYALTDSTAVVAAIHPELFTIVETDVQIDLSNGPAYGTSYCYVNKDIVSSRLARLDGIWDGFVQPAILPGAASAPASISSALSSNACGVQAECLKRLHLASQTLGHGVSNSRTGGTPETAKPGSSTNSSRDPAMTEGKT